jgi:hypothetical protein
MATHRAVLVGGLHHGHVTNVEGETPPFEVVVGREGTKYVRRNYEVYVVDDDEQCLQCHRPHSDVIHYVADLYNHHTFEGVG